MESAEESEESEEVAVTANGRLAIVSLVRAEMCILKTPFWPKRSARESRLLGQDTADLWEIQASTSFDVCQQRQRGQPV